VITEHALLPVSPGQEHAFEVAFSDARFHHRFDGWLPGFVVLAIGRVAEHLFATR